MGLLKFAINWKHTGLFAAGVAFGTAGVRILSSKDAKKLYVGCTAAALRAKDCVMKTVTNIQENAEDIYEEAKAVNEERAAAEEAAEFSVDAESEEGAGAEAFVDEDSEDYAEVGTGNE